eukprot:9945507-Alexandrium_andersonii.AAC.1
MDCTDTPRLWTKRGLRCRAADSFFVLQKTATKGTGRCSNWPMSGHCSEGSRRSPSLRASCLYSWARHLPRLPCFRLSYTRRGVRAACTC